MLEEKKAQVPVKVTVSGNLNTMALSFFFSPPPPARRPHPLPRWPCRL